MKKKTYDLLPDRANHSTSVYNYGIFEEIYQRKKWAFNPDDFDTVERSFAFFRVEKFNRNDDSVWYFLKEVDKTGFRFRLEDEEILVEVCEKGEFRELCYSDQGVSKLKQEIEDTNRLINCLGICWFGKRRKMKNELQAKLADLEERMESIQQLRYNISRR